MARRFSQYEKTQLLLKEFETFQKRHDELITQDQLLAYIDRKLGNEFDRAVATQLYERMDQHYDQVSVDEFIKVFLQAEDVLQNKIDNSKKFLEDYHRQHSQAQVRLQEIQDTEQLNSYGIMQGSTVFLIVHQAELRNDRDTNGQPFLNIICGNTENKTAPGKGQHPYWDESFHLQIETGLEDINLYLMEYHSNDIISQLNIPLNRLQDQFKHDQWFDLYDKNGSNFKGRIHLTLQWIHSRVKYLLEVVHQWQEHIRMQEEDLEDYTRDLTTLYQPFKFYTRSVQSEFSNASPSVQTPIQERPKFNPNEPGSAIVDNNFTQAHQHADTIIQICLVLGLIVLLNHIYRTLYLDLLILMVFYAHVHEDTITSRELKLLAFLVLVSWGMDIGWIIDFSTAWWGGTSKSLTDDPAEVKIQQYTVFMTYLQFLYKLLVAAAFLFLAFEFKQIQETQPVASDSQMKSGSVYENNDTSNLYAGKNSPFVDHNNQSPPQYNPYQ